MTSLRFLGFCGLASSILTFAAGSGHSSVALAWAGAIMTLGNLVAMGARETPKPRENRLTPQNVDPAAHCLFAECTLTGPHTHIIQHLPLVASVSHNPTVLPQEKS